MDLKKAVSQLGGDLDSLRKEYEEVSSTLCRLGFTDYESRAYIALVALGSSSANNVAEIAQMPRTSAYKSMNSLVDKGLVVAQKGRPRAFAAVDPQEVSARLSSDVEKSFARISAVRDMLSERGVPQLVYTIIGKERVYDKIGEMLEKCEHTLVISTPSIPQLRSRLSKRFASAVTRGVKVTLITSPFVKAIGGVTVIRRKGLIATDVISDGRTALIAAPDLSACGYTDNEALSRHLEDFLNIMAERRD